MPALAARDAHLMTTTQQVQLELGAPQAGWLHCKLVVGSYVLECSASNVANDPLKEFITLLARIGHPWSAARPVELWLEPAIYILELTDAGEDQLRLRVLFHHDSYPQVQESDGYEIRFEGSVDRAIFALSIDSALKEFFRRFTDVTPNNWETFKSCRLAYAVFD